MISFANCIFQMSSGGNSLYVNFTKSLTLHFFAIFRRFHRFWPVLERQSSCSFPNIVPSTDFFYFQTLSMNSTYLFNMENLMCGTFESVSRKYLCEFLGRPKDRLIQTFQDFLIRIASPPKWFQSGAP